MSREFVKYHRIQQRVRLQGTALCRELEDLQSNDRQTKSSMQRLKAASHAANADLNFLRQQLDTSEASRRRLEAAMLDSRAAAEKAKQEVRILTASFDAGYPFLLPGSHHKSANQSLHNIDRV